MADASRAAWFSIGALIGGILGVGATSAWAPGPREGPREGIPAISEPIASPTTPAQPLPVLPAPAAPDDLATMTKANQLGCDCPLPPPVDVDPVYLPPGVEAWLDRLDRDCPEFAQRETTVDCTEFPCMLTVAAERGEWQREDLVSFLTCGLDGPALVSQGNVGSSVETLAHLFSVRPPELREYSHREFVRGPRLAR